MRSNNTDFIKTFKENFKEYKNKNIFLYGIGENTEIILNEINDYNVLGLLDGVKKNEYMYGKYIYNINDIPELKPDAIIIVARATTVRIIVKRIEDFCRKNKIRLYDLNRNDLLDTKTFENEEPYFDLSFDSLKKQIDAHEAISFDIFDTLLMRRVLFPGDVFDITAERIGSKDLDFKKIRTETERNSFRNSCPELSEIYSIIKTNYGLTAEQAGYYMDTEISVENDVIIPRKAMVKLFDHAVASGKKVYLISDMYLNKNILKKILYNNGITGYEDIFLSCEHKCFKSNGLYKIYKKKVKADSYLHIGDNEFADGKCAESEEIKSCIIKSAYDLAFISSYSEILDKTEEFNSRLYIGIFISEIFNDPFSLCGSKGKLTLNAPCDIGWFTAPIITEFMFWLKDSVIRAKCENILFAARDGYIINKLYDIMKKKYEDLPGAVYFLTSRMSCIAACACNEKCFDYACDMDFSETPEKLLEKRFFLNKKNIKKYDKNKYSSIKEYIYDHYDEIIAISDICRNNYLKYIENLNIDISKKTAFFDFASSGTSQMFLEVMLDTILYGFYFLRFNDCNEQKSKLNIESMQKPTQFFEENSNLSKKYCFMETILTSDKPSLKAFSESGEPIYLNEHRNNDEMEAVEDIHKCITRFFEIFLDFYIKKECYEYNLIPDIIFGLLDGKKTNFNIRYLLDSVFKDDCKVRDYEVINMIE